MGSGKTEGRPSTEVELEAHESDTFDLRPEAIERIISAIDSAKPISGSLCDAAAFLYHSEQNAWARSTGRGTKADLRKLKASIAAAADQLEGARLQVSLLVGVNWSLRHQSSAGPSGIHRIQDLASELRWLASAIADTEKYFHRPLPDLDFGMMMALTFLVSAFEIATGKRATHSAHRDGEYIGRPLSQFGRLVVAFFQEVDPALSETQISSAIRKHLSTHRQREREQGK